MFFHHGGFHGERHRYARIHRNARSDGRDIAFTSAEDALHISLAAVHGMDFLLTWNFRHINDAEMKARIRTVVESAGYECPVICSPEELGGVDS